MLTPVFHVMDLKSRGFERLARVTDVIQFTSRKDVLQDEPMFGADAMKAAPAFCRRPRDAVIEQNAPIAQERVDLPELLVVIRDANMLVHADAGDLVVFSVQRGVIAQLNRDLLLQTQAADLFQRKIMLLLRE